MSNMTQLIEKLRAKITAHNTALAVVDYSKAEIEELEETLGNLCEKMLIGIAFKYGKDSHEYEMAGGVRTSERIRKSRITRFKAVAEKKSSESVETV